MPMELNDEEFSKSMEELSKMKKLSKTDLKNFGHGWIYYKKEKKVWEAFDVDQHTETEQD